MSTPKNLDDGYGFPLRQDWELVKDELPLSIILEGRKEIILIDEEGIKTRPGWMLGFAFVASSPDIRIHFKWQGPGPAHLPFERDFTHTEINDVKITAYNTIAPWIQGTFANPFNMMYAPTPGLPYNGGLKVWISSEIDTNATINNLIVVRIRFEPRKEEKSSES